VKWDVSKSGPGWTEILTYLVALDTLHGSTSWLDMSSAGSKHGTAWRVSVVSVFPAVSGAGRVKKVVSNVTWPNVDSADLASAIYKLVLEHDYRISEEAYVQQTLPGA